MKFCKPSDELNKAFLDYIAYEKDLIKMLGEEWDIAESLVLTNADAVFTLQEQPGGNDNPLYMSLEFGLDDILSGFDNLIESKSRRSSSLPKNLGLYYFVYGRVVMIYAVDTNMEGTKYITDSLASFKLKTADYFSEKMLNRYRLGEIVAVERADA